MANLQALTKAKPAKPPVLHADNAHNVDYMLCCFALFFLASFFYGPRVFLLAIVAWLSAIITDRICIILRGLKYDASDNSSLLFAFLLALMLPATVPVYVLVFTIVAAVLLGKHAFGGSVNYPFNPVAVGYSIAVISWPDAVLKFPQPINWVTLFASALNGADIWSTLGLQNTVFSQSSAGALQAGIFPKYSIWSMFLGDAPSPLGTGSVVVILACAVFLFIRKRISTAVTFTFVITIAAAFFLFPRAPLGAVSVFPWENWQARLFSSGYELLSGSTMFAAVFLANEQKTLPKNTRSRILYGLLLAASTFIFRHFGVYEIGICFAFLAVNALSGFVDRLFAGAPTASPVATKEAGK